MCCMIPVGGNPPGTLQNNVTLGHRTCSQPPLVEVVVRKERGSQCQGGIPYFTASASSKHLPVGELGLMVVWISPGRMDSTCGLGVPQRQHENSHPHLGTLLGILVKNHFKKAGPGPACPAWADVCAGNVNDAPSPIYHTWWWPGLFWQG